MILRVITQLRLLSPFAFLCAIVLVLFVALALSASWISPQNPYDNSMVNFVNGDLPPGTRLVDSGFIAILGTDALGRDMFSAILYGLRTSLVLSGLAATLALLLGGVAGLVAAYYRGLPEAIIMRAVDIKLGFPTILVAMIIMAIFGSGYFELVFALVLAQWAYYARAARSVALVEMGKEYIEAAHCLELPVSTIIVRHLLPNSFAPLLVVFTIQLAHAIAIESALSFLGMGVSIEAPSLGLLIANGSKEILSGHTWQLVYPGLALATLIFTINVVGEKLRSLLDPRSARR